MPFPPDDLALLAGAEEIVIETRAAPNAELHRTTIWVVTDGPDAFIRSYRGPTARWYREATAHEVPVAIEVGDGRFAARVIHAVDQSSIERTSRALAEKYRGDSGVPGMLTPEFLDTTLRLEPA